MEDNRADKNRSADLVITYEITYVDDGESDGVVIIASGDVNGNYRPYATTGIGAAMGLSLRNALADALGKDLVNQKEMDKLSELTAKRFLSAICGHQHDVIDTSAKDDESEGKG